MRSLLCKLNGHNLSSIKKDSTLIKEYQCKNCQQEFTTDGYGQIVRLNSYWKRNNSLFENLLEKQQSAAVS